MARELPLTLDQRLAKNRHDLQGTIYLLSGTLRGRRTGVADIDFRWSNLTFDAGPLDEYEEYIGYPSVIRRGQRFLPGAGSDNPAIKIPVYNLKFGESTSLFSAWDDGDYAFEDSIASVRVGYLRPGQPAEDLNPNDFTFLVKEGFLGPPEGVDLDGFVLPIYSRGNMRNRAFRQPRNVGDITLISGAMMKKDVGVPLPVIVGKPDSWFRPPTFDCGVRGFTTSGFGVGATDIEFSLITAGQMELDAAVDFNILGNTYFGGALSGQVLFIDRQKPGYLIDSVQLFDQTSGVVKVTLASGLAIDVARGSFVQEDPRYRGVPQGSTPGQTQPGYPEWIIAAHDIFSNAVGGTVSRWQEDLNGNVGWLFTDGTIRIADPGFWAFESRQIDMNNQSTASQYEPLRAGLNGNTLFRVLRQSVHTIATQTTAPEVPERRTDQSDSPQPPEMYPPTWFDPRGDDPVEVTAQPTFSSQQLAASKLNYPTGGTGTNNANARDGNTDTATSLTVGAFITLTFNSAPSPFVDTDTVASTLHAVTQGNINFENSLGSITFGQATGTGGVNREFRFTQSTARNFNETVRCEGAGGSGGSVAEVWWEHDLSAVVNNTRTQDVELSSTGGGVPPTAIGPRMQFTDLVMRIPSQKNGVAGKGWSTRNVGGGISFFSGNHDEQDPDDTFSNFLTVSGTGGAGNQGTYNIAYPTPAMEALQAIFLGKQFGSAKDINSDVYSVAHQKFIDADIRWGFVLQRKLDDWTGLEQDLAGQSRSHFYYGPEGHEIVFMETNESFELSGAIAEFRLPGTPGANAEQPGNATMIERTRTDEIINTVRAIFNQDYLTNTFQKTAEKSNADSVAAHGDRRDPRGDYTFWAHSTFAQHPTYDAEKVASGIVQFYADRGAFALTRYTFDTAWPAFGIERGSPIRIVYPIVAGDKDENYRNVLCEVEDIGDSPGEGGRFEIKCRALGTPARGLPAFRWLDRYLTLTEVWTDRLRENDAWRDRWSV